MLKRPHTHTVWIYMQKHTSTCRRTFARICAPVQPWLHTSFCSPTETSVCVSMGNTFR